MKKIFLPFILINILAVSKVFACGYSITDEELRVFIMDPFFADGNKALSDFRYTSRFLHDADAELPDENIEEWFHYFNGTFSKKELADFIYHSSLEDFLSIGNGEIPDSSILCSNSLADEVISGKLTGFFEYMSLAKKVESICSSEKDIWRRNGYGKNREGLIEESRKKTLESEDVMLRQRYAYQTILLNRYMITEASNKNAISLYETVFNEIPDGQESIIKYWALFHTAVCKYREGNKEESQLDFTHVFFNCDAKKRASYLQFNREKLDDLLSKKTLSSKQRQEVLVARQMKNPGRALPALKELGEMDINSTYLRTLLVREVNKIEEWLLTPIYTDKITDGMYYRHQREGESYWSWRNEVKRDSIMSSDYRYLERLIAFMELRLNEGKVKDRAFWELMVAHCYFIYGSPDMCSIYLNRARNRKTGETLSVQLRITGILNALLNTPDFDAKFEQYLYKELSWLHSNTDIFDVNEGCWHPDCTMHSGFNILLAIFHAYHKKGMNDKAALILTGGTYGLNKVEDEGDRHRRWGVFARYWQHQDPFLYLDEHGSIEETINYLNILEKKRKSPLEKLLTQYQRYPKERFYDLIGTKYLRKQDLKNALKWYEEVPKEFWKSDDFYYNDYLTNNPFRTFRKGMEPSYFVNNFKYKEIPWDEEGAARLNGDIFRDKSIFIQELIHLKKRYQNSVGNVKAKYAYQLGNAYYALSFEGRHWHTIAYVKVSYPREYNKGYAPWTKHAKYINKNYHDNSTAAYYFQEAYKYCELSDYKPMILERGGYILLCTDFEKYNNRKKNYFVDEMFRHFPEEGSILSCPGWVE